jgi:uncharacterized protein YcnI
MLRIALGAGAILLAAAPASAHVTLAPATARAGSYVKVDFRVPHGCDGSATIRLTVRIPDGVASVKPQPKPGWTLTIAREKPASPAEDGHVATGRVTEVTWSGGRLLDANFDEFGLFMKVPNRPDTVLYFPAIQACEHGVRRWIDTMAHSSHAQPHGHGHHHGGEPAPALKLGPKAAAE